MRLNLPQAAGSQGPETLHNGGPFQNFSICPASSVVGSESALNSPPDQSPAQHPAGAIAECGLWRMKAIYR
jgi:hypothetical protein